MELSLALVGNLTSMMLMMAVGFVVVRCGILKAQDSKAMSILLVYVFQSCLLIQCFQLEVTPERMKGYVAGLVFGTVAMFFQIFVARLLRKPFHLSNIDEASIIYSNCGNIIIPLVLMSLGEEMVFYCSAFTIPFNIIMWTHGIYLIRGEKNLNLKKILLTPCLLATYFGLFLMITGLRLPSIVSSAVDGLSAMVAPVSMITVGMMVGESDLRAVFTDRRSYLISFGRLVLIPFLTLFVLYATGIVQRMPWLRPIFMVSMMAVAAPQAATVAQLANVYDKEPARAGMYNVMTTLLCFVTLPAVIMVYQMVFPG